MFKEVYHIRTPYKDVIEIIVFRELRRITVTTNSIINQIVLKSISNKIDSIQDIKMFSIQILTTFA